MSAATNSFTLLMVVLSACAPPSTVARQPRFYFDSPSGSEAQFNPLTELLNEGFDVLRTNSQDRHVFRRQYGLAARNVLRSVQHADATLRFYGYANAVHKEWLPLSTSSTPGGGAWIPNYEYHLIGGGMISVRMTEWFEARDVAHPALWSFATLMSSHFLNEVIENGTSTLPNEDATTDLLLFDLGGVALWHVDAVQRLFSGPMQLTNWPGQPSIDLPSGTLENARQQFVLRAPLPWTTRWRLFYDFGLSSLLGASRQLENGDAISAGFGVDAIDNPIVDPATGAKTATLHAKGGVFYDRRGSLLWSVQVGSRSDAAVVAADVYPGVVTIAGIRPGLWLQLPRAGGVRFGVAGAWGFGIGHGPER